MDILKHLKIEVEIHFYIELNALLVYDDRYIKTKIRMYGDEVYPNFHSSNVVEDGVECESFTVISIDSLPVYDNKCYILASVFRHLCL